MRGKQPAWLSFYAPWSALMACPMFLSLGTVGIIGCNPSPTKATASTKASTIAVSRLPSKGKTTVQPRPATKKAVSPGPEYVLPFEARANPFALPKPKVTDRSPRTRSVNASDVALVGLMRKGDQSLAVIDVDDRQYTVFEGTELGPMSGAEGLRVIEIRESEIVVEQSGKQWIVPLPRP